MKFILSLLFLLVPVSTFAQTLVKNEVDEFTSLRIMETSWEFLLPPMSQNVHFRTKKIENNYYFDLKWMDRTGTAVYSIDKADELMFKLENGTIVKLPCIEYVISCIGCGATGFAGSEGMGINPMYHIDNKSYELLKGNTIVKMRFYTTDGYLERDIKQKYSDKINSSLTLLQ